MAADVAVEAEVVLLKGLSALCPPGHLGARPAGGRLPEFCPPFPSVKHPCFWEALRIGNLPTIDQN